MIRQLKTKIKEQENSISGLGSAIERFLKIQPIVKKLQGNISKISKHVVPRDKFKITVPKIDDSEIVKPFTPSLEKSVGMTKHKPTISKEAKAEMDLFILSWFPGRAQDTTADTTKHPMTTEKKSCKLSACVLQTINQHQSRVILNRIVLRQNQTYTHRKMTVQIIQEQSQKHPEVILR